jgi:isoprenylcysteine carboxyl methyltransferase (ICMT) family protein YpbQ
MGVLDRLDALDRRAGFGGPSPRPWHERRAPYAVMAAGVLYLLEWQSFLRLALDHVEGLVVLAFVLAFAVVFIGTVVVLYTPRPWALRVLVAIQAPVVGRVVYRAIDNPARLVGLLYVAAAVALLTVPRSSRRFYRGEWHKRAMTG